ncbi:transposase [Streptomyces sp. V4I8]
MEDRKVINGMVYKIRTGISWRDLPERYGPWKTAYTRFRRYALDGVFTRAPQQIQAHADAVGDIDWLVQIDATVVRLGTLIPGLEEHQIPGEIPEKPLRVKLRGGPLSEGADQAGTKNLSLMAGQEGYRIGLGSECRRLVRVAAAARQRSSRDGLPLR